MNKEIILSELEASIMDAHGYDVVKWLQDNYLLYKGEWGDDVDEEEREHLIAFAKKSISDKRLKPIKEKVDAHLALPSPFDALHNAMVADLNRIYGKSVLTRPIAAGQTTISADIIRINPYFKGRTRKEPS